MWPSAVRGAGKPLGASGPLLLICAVAVNERAAASKNRAIKLLRRLQADQRAVLFIREHVDQIVGTLPYVADALVHLDEQRLARGLIPLFIKDEPLEVRIARNGPAQLGSSSMKSGM